MAKIGLVYLNDEPQLSMGLGYISAVLKKGGHSVVLWDTYYKKDEEVSKDMINSNIQMAMFSVHTLSYDRALTIANAVKKKRPDIKILFGGWHSVIDPEGMLKEDSVDMVCVGEGEYAALDVANDIDATGFKNVGDIFNIYSKSNGTVIKNLPRKLGSLDDLPILDRDIFNTNSLMDRDGKFFFSTGRGCPYYCSYCCNKKMVKMYSDIDSPYVRLRSVENCIEELQMIKEKYNPTELFFTDEMFLISERRVLDFCKAYKEAKIGIPFGFMARVEKMNNEIAQALKEAGCIRIHFGIESGNEELRRKYLNREMTNEEIITAFDICRKYGIKTASFNMIGLPFETKQTIKDTFDINKRCNPDAFQISILFPFPGTEIRETYRKNDMLNLDKTKSGDLYDTYITKNKNISFPYIKHQQVFMELYFNYSKFFAHLSKIVPTGMLRKYLILTSFIFKKNKLRTLRAKYKKKMSSKHNSIGIGMFVWKLMPEYFQSIFKRIYFLNRFSGKYIRMQFPIHVGMSKELFLGKGVNISGNVKIHGKIKIGDYTYVNGPAFIEGDDIEIGKFCSIASGVSIRSDSHPLNKPTTYPIGKIIKKNIKLPHKPIKIGNDVWLGKNVIILGGVIIGDGAVVGAGAVVTKNVEPYTIVVGVPAKRLRKRFDERSIKKLQELKWWNWSEEKIQANPEFFLKDFEIDD